MFKHIAQNIKQIKNGCASRLNILGNNVYWIVGLKMDESTV